MRCPTLGELPPPPPGRTGWPWTEESRPASSNPHQGAWPKVSIVTPTFNHGEYLEETIRSVLLQGYPSLEYIVIDGGSKDGSVGIIQKYERWLGYWLSEPDGGPVFGANKGTAMATGEVLGLMCSDDFYMPGGIQKLVDLRAAHPTSVAWVGACRTLEDGKTIDDGLPFIHSMDEIGDWGESAWFNSEACLFDAECYRAVGGLDERFLNGNDIDLWVKIAKKGSFVLTDEAVATYRRNLQSVSNRDYDAEISSWIASNYFHGNQEVATTILARYGERKALQAVSSAAIGAFVRLKVHRALEPVLGWLKRG